jgi:hypothetical protein
MNAKIILAMMFVFLLVFSSGCIKTDDGTGSSTEQPDQASEQEIIGNLNNDIIDESETIDIGELI